MKPQVVILLVIIFIVILIVLSSEKRSSKEPFRRGWGGGWRPRFYRWSRPFRPFRWWGHPYRYIVEKPVIVERPILSGELMKTSIYPDVCSKYGLTIDESILQFGPLEWCEIGVLIDQSTSSGTIHSSSRLFAQFVGGSKQWRYKIKNNLDGTEIYLDNINKVLRNGDILKNIPTFLGDVKVQINIEPTFVFRG